MGMENHSISRIRPTKMVHEQSSFLTQEMQVLQLRYRHALTHISKCQAKTFCTNLTQPNAEGLPQSDSVNHYRITSTTQNPEIQRLKFKRTCLPNDKRVSGKKLDNG